MHSIGRFVGQLTLLAALGLAAFSAQALDLRGFRGLAWGQGAEALGGARVVAADGEVSCYERDHENMLFGEQPVRRVRYCFHKDHLFMVTLDASVGLDAMVSEFRLSYGQPQARQINRTSWGDATTVARAELETLRPGSTSSRLTIRSNRFEPAVARTAAAGLTHGGAVLR